MSKRWREISAGMSNFIEQVPDERIARTIREIRGHRVMLDSTLAELYGVTTKRFNEQVRRNLGRFPSDFMFQLTQDEWDALRSQSATLETGRGRHRKYLPTAFTEHGALMAANVLNSTRAIEVSIYVVRAFLKLREALLSHRDLARQLEILERQTERLALRQDRFSVDTKAQFQQVFEALRSLMSPLAPPKKRPIGFVTDEVKKRSG